jgi:hypothetical protein
VASTGSMISSFAASAFEMLHVQQRTRRPDESKEGAACLIKSDSDISYSSASGTRNSDSGGGRCKPR